MAKSTALVKTEAKPAPIEPAEVWSPSAGTEPMPLPGEIAPAPEVREGAWPGEGWVCNWCRCAGCPYGTMYGWVYTGERGGGPFNRDFRSAYAYLRSSAAMWRVEYLGVRREPTWAEGGSYQGADFAYVAVDEEEQVIPSVQEYLRLNDPGPRRFYSSPWNRYMERGRQRTYQNNPVGCPHQRKRYRSDDGWKCMDCGESLKGRQ